MGYRGKVELQARARLLRAEGMTMPDIASKLGVARSSVSLWTKDVPFVAGPRRPRPRGPNVLARRKQAEIETLLAEGRAWIGALSEREFLMAGVALYAGEGSKRDGSVTFANSDPRMMTFFVAWLRHFFEVDESRLRVRVYLHEGLDLEAAHVFWSSVTGVPIPQFRSGYRPKADPSIRENKHEHGCGYLVYSCSRTHRAIMGLVAALLESCPAIPG
jgi:transcriptional regulator with XRE-family HTH domain